MSDALELAFEELRREYLLEAPGRLDEIRKDIAAFEAGEPDSAEALRTRFHRLAGSGGSYGFPDVSLVARELEQWSISSPSPHDPTLERGMVRLGAAFDAAVLTMGPAFETAPAKFGWRARVAVHAPALRAELSAALEAAGFVVDPAMTAAELASALPRDRPDLVVLGSDADDASPYDEAVAWTRDPYRRPRAVIVLEDSVPVDRIRAVAAGADVVITADHAMIDLPRYGQSLARQSEPPLRVVLYDGDDAGARAIADLLEGGGIRVERVTALGEAPAALAAAIPDVVLAVEREGPSADARVLARFIRQDARTSLVPLVLCGSDGSTAVRVSALRAGATDFLALPVDPELLIESVTAHGARARRVSALVHRDPLTGLLNFAAMRSELDHAAAYARRYQDPFAFLILDVDHFRRINERHGHVVGDRVLAHVASTLTANLRSSDSIARYGGEEFAVLLRVATRDCARGVAEKLRRVLRDAPFITVEGGLIPVIASIGLAAWGTDGTRGGELAQAADRALHRAKGAGRDRIEVGG